MSGDTLMLSGDFRQTLSVNVRVTIIRADIIRPCLKSSLLWKSVLTLKLYTNMNNHLGRGNKDKVLESGKKIVLDKVPWWNCDQHWRPNL